MLEQIALQHILRKSFVDLQSKNPQYSLRSFSKKLDVHVGALSSIMNGKRRVSKDLAERLALRLMLDPQERSELLEKFPVKRMAEEATSGPKYLEIEASQFKMIAEWEHYAVLSLFNCTGFKDDPAWISARLGISETRALEVLRRLLDMQFIKRNSEDKLVRSKPEFRTSDDTIDLSIRKSHEVNLELAKTSLNHDDVSERDFTYITLAANPEKLGSAKEMIRKFQDQLSEVLETGEKTEVYRMSIQLFPLTKLQSKRGTI